MHRHFCTNNRAPRWTFKDPCKPEVWPGAREVSASPAWLAAPAANAHDTTKGYIWRLDTGSGPTLYKKCHSHNTLGKRHNNTWVEPLAGNCITSSTRQREQVWQKFKIQKNWCTVTVAPTIEHHGGHSRALFVYTLNPHSVMDAPIMLIVRWLPNVKVYPWQPIFGEPIMSMMFFFVVCFSISTTRYLEVAISSMEAIPFQVYCRLTFGFRHESQYLELRPNEMVGKTTASLNSVGHNQVFQPWS